MPKSSSFAEGRGERARRTTRDFLVAFWRRIFLRWENLEYLRTTAFYRQCMGYNEPGSLFHEKKIPWMWVQWLVPKGRVRSMTLLRTERGMDPII